MISNPVWSISTVNVHVNTNCAKTSINSQLSSGGNWQPVWETSHLRNNSSSTWKPQTFLMMMMMMMMRKWWWRGRWWWWWRWWRRWGGGEWRGRPDEEKRWISHRPSPNSNAGPLPLPNLPKRLTAPPPPPVWTNSILEAGFVIWVVRSWMTKSTI